MSNSTTTETTAITVRIDNEIVEAIDELAELLSARASGLRVTRSDALRVAAKRGAEVLRAEHSTIATTKKK